VDFEKTPVKFQGTPPVDTAAPLAGGGDLSSPEKEAAPIPPVVAAYLDNDDTAADESSPSLVIPEAVSLPPPGPALPAARASRFQAGFLSKARASEHGSPAPPTLSLHLSSSDTEGPSPQSVPLRSVDPGQAGNALSPPRKSLLSPKSGRLATLDENSPPSNNTDGASMDLDAKIGGGVGGAGSNASSDSECSGIDTDKLRSALHSAKRHNRLSILQGQTGTAGQTKRVSSAGSHGSASGAAGAVAGNGMGTGHRPSASYSGGYPLASSLNGISRASRRGSAERRRSPPLTCTPPDSSSDNIAAAGGGGGGGGGGRFSVREGAVSRAFTPSQARRLGPAAGQADKAVGLGINGSASVRSPSERERPAGVDGRARRITIGAGLGANATLGPGAGGGVPGVKQRPSSVVWR
jgi:kinesin family member 18/19